MRTVIFAGVLLSFVFILSGAQAAENNDPLAIILKLQGEINVALAKMDAEVSTAARQLQKTGIEGEEARNIIRGLAKSSDYAIDCAATDVKGIMKIVEPEGYKKYEGSDISKQEQVIHLHKTLSPAMGDAFKSVEGFYAAAIEHPVFSTKGDLIGSVSMLFKPEDLLSSIVKSEIKNLPVHTWVMQTDGRDIYDDDPSQIGKIIPEDPLYKPFPSVIEFARKVIREKSGSGSYDFYDINTKEVVQKDSVWTTIGIHGTQWRLVVTKKEPVPSGNALMDAVIKNEAQLAVSMLQAICDKHKKGEMTLEQAKKMGADILRELRYGDNKQGYFWADTTEGVNVVLYGDKDVEGKNRCDANLNGIYYIREIIANGKKAGGGYTDYWFPKKGGTEPVRKRGYSVLFKPFGWVIGTGYYID